MSTTISSATATCKIPFVHSIEELAAAVVDYFVNHPDEIPESLDADDLDSDEVCCIIESYLTINSGDGTYCDLLIAYDSECGPTDPEVFDFLAKHFACLQVSPFMAIASNTFDSRSGTAHDAWYLGRDGKEIDIERSEQLLQAIADALWADGADTPWTPDTLGAIAEAIELQRPDLKASRA